MARPILLELPPRDPRIELQSRLQNAPAQHAEALLSAYEVLQGLHDRGVLDLLRGALGSSDQVLEIAVEAARAPNAIRGLRNLLVLVDMLGSIEPETLKIFTQAVPPALTAVVQQSEPPGLWRMFKNFLWNRDFRRGLSAVNTLLITLGRGLAGKTKSSEIRSGSSGLGIRRFLLGISGRIGHDAEDAILGNAVAANAARALCRQTSPFCHQG